MMEALWGPRVGGSAGPIARPSDGDTGPRHEDQVEKAGGAVDAFRAELAAVELKIASELASVRAELADLRASLDAAGRSATEAGVSAELERLEGQRRESAARLDALESSVGSEVQRLSLDLAAALRAVAGGVVTPAEHAQLRADLQSQMGEQLQEAMQQVDVRATEIEAGLNGCFEAAISPADFDALRAELKEALSTNMASAQTVLRQRTALLDATVADLKAQVARRLEEMATLVATEAAAAAERAALAVLRRQLPSS